MDIFLVEKELKLTLCVLLIAMHILPHCLLGVLPLETPHSYCIFWSSEKVEKLWLLGLQADSVSIILV